MRFLYKISLFKKETEFFLILACLLFFPGKNSYLYFLACAAVFVIFLLKELYFIKNAGFSPVTTGLFAVNLVFLISTFFSSYRIRSVLLVSDFLLISFYFFLSYLDRNDEDRYFFIILVAISLFSFAYILNFFLQVFGDQNIFYESPILQGIGSGAGVIITVFYLLKKLKINLFIFLLINSMAVYMSGSKAAFLGVAVSVVFMVVLKKKFLLPAIVAVLILTFVIPNPIKNVFFGSLKHDPYVFNRIDIWKLSWRMFEDHAITGVGLDNFQDVSKKYNFKQKKGPANYFKIPRSPHNDYLKIMAETGLTGAILVLVFLIVVLVRVFSSTLFNLNKILILYLLSQAFLFNILFQFFFLFLLIFILKNLFEESLSFRTLQGHTKLILSGFFILVLIFSYVSPFISNHYMERAKKSNVLTKTMDFLNKSEFVHPFNQNIYYSKSLLLYHHFQQTSDLETFSSGVESVKKVQELNRNYLPAYLLEFNFKLEMYKKGLNYQEFSGELIAPLDKAEAIAPLNPFVRLMKAQVYLEFGERSKAEAAALASLEIEPDYVSARYFLHDNFNHMPDQEKFESEIRSILRRAREYSPEKGSYLDQLYRVPARAYKGLPLK